MHVCTICHRSRFYNPPAREEIADPSVYYSVMYNDGDFYAHLVAVAMSSCIMAHKIEAQLTCKLSSSSEATKCIAWRLRIVYM